MYKILLITTLFCQAVCTYAQQNNTGTPALDVFTACGYIGIPRDGKVKFYSQKYDELKNDHPWMLSGEFSIPAGTVALAGNERKLIILFRDSIVFYEMNYEEDRGLKWERYRAYSFDPTVKITPQNWIRNAYSTECDFTYLEGNLEKGYAYDGGRWINLNELIYKNAKPLQPLVVCGDNKYFFDYQTSGIAVARVTKEAVTFCLPSTFSLLTLKKYMKAEELNNQVKEMESKTFILPTGTESVFIYQWETIATVNKQGIEFFLYSKKNGKWEKQNNMTLLFK
ncbi:MAG: hypothetical protein ACJ751_26385 [Niastella sp.]|uniref:hypothetical protein n=1 Tax=Niastella sp. TaxID=1869183 RepID=UPI00389A7E95